VSSTDDNPESHTADMRISRLSCFIRVWCQLTAASDIQHSQTTGVQPG